MGNIPFDTLLNTRQGATRALTDAAEGLTSLHDCLFPKDLKEDAKALLDHIHLMLSGLEVCSAHAGAPLNPKKRGTIDPENLILQGVGLMGDLFISAALNLSCDTKKVKRLDKYILPQLFLSTTLKPDMLCDIALKMPLQVLSQSAFPRSTGGDLHNTLKDWRVNFGCNFLPTTMVAESKAHAPRSDSPVRSMDCASAAVKKQPSAPAAWNSSARTTQHAVTRVNRDIPSYLLSKRGSRSSLTMPPASSKQEAYVQHQDAITSIMESEDSNSILALESPVKRRRIDLSRFVLPSPSRPAYRSESP